MFHLTYTKLSAFDFLQLHGGFVTVDKKGSIITIAALKVTCQAECPSHRNLTIRNYLKRLKFRFYRYATVRFNNTAAECGKREDCLYTDTPNALCN